MGKILRHVRHWLEAYFWLPASLVLVVGASYLYQSLTGRPVAENPIWLVGYAEKLVQLILLLLCATVIKQQTGSMWTSREEQLELQRKYASYAAISALKTPFYFAVAAYILLH